MEHRTARITTEGRSLKELEAYMPANYHVVVTVYGLFIHGHDEAGWTLDGYVLPRLASGMIFAHEITPPGVPVAPSE